MHGSRDSPLDAISFSGCGTLNFYQTGVAASLQDAGMVEGMRFAGASAGSGLATLVAAGIPAKAISETAIEILAPFGGKNILAHPDILVAFARDFLAAFVVPETLERIGERVHISITRLRGLRNWQVHQFTDIDDLCRAIRASCHIPSPRRRTVKFRGYRCLDGGFSVNSPLIGERCLSISPFALSRLADLRPSARLNPMRAVVVPSRQQAEELFQLGHHDGKRLLSALAGGAIRIRKTSERQPIRRRLAPYLPRVL